jgi:hypothetical protein
MQLRALQLLAVLLVAFALLATPSTTETVVASAQLMRSQHAGNDANALRRRTATPAPARTPTPSPTPLPGTSGYWVPPQATEWQWQLTGSLDTSLNVSLYDIDLFDNNASVVGALHASGKHVFCYLDAGTWENWRPDAGGFPSSVLGSSNGWPGERWLDIRNLAALGPIMQSRLDLCRAKGFDGVEFDNVDGYTNRTGFKLSAQDQLTYNIWLASQAHARSLSAGLKNDVDQVQELEPHFDWMLDEQCFQYDECSTLLPFVQSGKAVFEVEYKLNTSQFCPQANALNFNAMKKKTSLGASRTPCR